MFLGGGRGERDQLVGGVVFEQRGNEGKRRVVGVAVVVGGDFF